MEQAELAEIDAAIETTPAPATAEELLGLAKSLIADDLLTPEQLKMLQDDPLDFLRSLLPEAPSAASAVMVSDVKEAIVKGYFQSLLAKASEGEKYDEKRVKDCLLKAQVNALEALAQAVGESTTSIADKIRIAEVLQS